MAYRVLDGGDVKVVNDYPGYSTLLRLDARNGLGGCNKDLKVVTGSIISAENCPKATRCTV